jgi:hypothetical protein
VGTSSDITSDASYLIQSVNANGGSIALGRNDSITGTNEIIGQITFYGNDGGFYEPSAQISCIADATHSSGDKPGRLVFSTTADSASTPTERMRIKSDGTVDIAGDLVLGPNSAPAVKSDTTGVTGADQITNMMSLTQAEYDAISSPDANTFYIITA